jgi:dynactin complex subunit
MMSLKFECENSNKEVGNYKELVFQLKDEINKCNKINQDLTSNNIELKKEIIEIIKYFKRYKKSIIIISHDEDIYNIFDETIEIK